MEWYFYLIAFTAFWLLRAVYYFFKLRQIKYLKIKYHNYLRDNTYDFLQYKPQIIELFKLANIKDFSITHVQRLTYSEGAVHSLSGFQNISSSRLDVVGVVKSKFEETIGTFNYRMKQSFNPLYWMEFILKLPEQIFSYLNFSIADSIMKIIQLLYWVAMVVIGLHAGKVIDISSWF